MIFTGPCMNMPKCDPEYGYEWENWKKEDFAHWLTEALDIIVPKIHLAPDEILEKIHRLRENAVRSLREDWSVEKDAEYLYTHIKKHFHLLRKELEIS